jgi:hypothetical protein
VEQLRGQVFVLFLFDVAEAFDLGAAARALGGGVQSKLAPKPATPPYVQYSQPPLWFEGSVADLPPLEGFRVGFKLFDYGVISFRLTLDFTGSWPDLVLTSNQLVENEALERYAEQASQSVLARLGTAATESRQTFLSEDYLVFAIHEMNRLHSADELVQHDGDVIASVLRGERAPLSHQEREEILRHRISYLADDLVIPSWNAAFVYDTDAGTQAALEIAEYANSQLLQFRYYDDLLDSALARIYAEMQKPAGWYDSLIGGARYARAAREVHALFIEVNELTDRAENALKIVGDVYAARLLALVEARLGLDQWKKNVNEKLKTLDDIYRFSVERVGMLRGEFLELTVVIILLFELVLFFLGIMT